MFSIEVPKATEEDENKIEDWVRELERKGKIKLRECVQPEYSVYWNHRVCIRIIGCLFIGDI